MTKDIALEAAFGAMREAKGDAMKSESMKSDAMGSGKH